MTHSRGSIALPALITTLIGASFALLFTNLTRYIQAQGTVEAATRAAIRCLVPTDGGCSQTSLDSGAGRNWQWYAADRRPALQSAATMFKYTAQVEEEQWQATYSLFTVPVGSPLVSVPSGVLPVKRYTAPIARAIRFGSYQRTIQHQGYYHPTWFPTYSQNIEEGTSGQSSYSERQWIGALAHQDPGVTRQQVTDMFQRRNFTRKIGAGQTVAFSTGSILVPALSPKLSCLPRSNCSLEGAASTAGDLGPSYRWDTHAVVAIKVFAEIEPAPGTRRTQVRWAKDLDKPYTESNSGLYFHTAGRTRSLGGRDASSSSISTLTDYPLWLRGTAGSVGSLSENSDHSGLVVRRGDSFSISAYLTAAAPTLAKVTILYYFDSPTAEPGEILTSESAEIQIPPGSAGDYCPKRSAFGMPETSEYKDISCKQVRSRRVADCGFNPAQSEPLAEAEALKPVRFVAQCSAADTALSFGAPILAAPPPADLTGQQLICGSWQEDLTYVGAIPLSGSFEACPLNKSAPRQSYPCGRQAPACVGTVPQASCSDISAVIAKSNSRISALWQEGSGDTADRPLLRAGIGTITAADTELLPFVINGSKDYLSRAEVPTEVRSCITETEHRTKNTKPILRSILPPPLSAFDLSSDFSEQQLRKTISFAKLTSTTRSISAVYPFNEPEVVEIGTTIPAGDFDTPICTGDSSKEASLEERLRHYASREIPGVVDPSVAFTFTATSRGTRLFPPHSYCSESSSPLPEGAHPCSKYAVIETTTYCPGAISLGTYADGTTPQRCLDTPQLCSKQVVTGSLQNSVASLNLNGSLATRVALNELRRSFPGIKTACTDPGCASVNLIEPNPGTAELETSYQVPLTWPLSDLLGRSTITASSKRRAELAAETVRR